MNDFYQNKIGRIELDARRDFEGPCSLNIVDGHNDHGKVIENILSIEELHDLKYLIERALVAMK